MPEQARDDQPQGGEQAIRDADQGAQVYEFPGGGGSELDQRCAKYLKNDVGNARRLIARFGKDLIHVQDVGWHAYTGTHWDREDGDRRAQILAHKTAMAMFNEAKALEAEGPRDGETPKDFRERIDAHKKWASGSGNSNRLSAMLREAQPYLTKRVEDMDANPRLLNLANGTLELRPAAKGGIRLRRHKREDMITRISPVKYDAKATCPIYDAFLAKIMPVEALRGYLQRWAGYSLTGETGEQCLSLFYGAGANGKSTMVDVWAYIAGDYAMTLPMASLLHDDRRRGSEASPDIARLPGARLVASGETNAGSRFDEALLKSLTGGDMMTARHLNKGFFEFKPQFKLVLSFNNKPVIRGQDEGIWRRLNMVPFGVVIPKEERDRDLPAKLRAEASGILNWMLDGLRAWLDAGLKVPDEVRAATDDYRAESDPVGQFLLAATEPAPGETVRAKDLYSAYCAWCRDNALTPISNNAFGRKCTDRGIERITIGVVFYRGIRIVPDYQGSGGDDGGQPPPAYGEDDYL